MSRSSIVRSANAQRNASFSFSRFGVINRISSPRCAVCFGGSNDGSWSLKGSSWRCSSMIVEMSSPSSGTDIFTNGPDVVLQFDHVVGSR